jgi:hypothetical protein
MKSQFKLSGTLVVATLLVGTMALPVAGSAQATGSNASLADTLTWLASFVPTATGGIGKLRDPETSNISNISGCNLVVTTTSPSYSSEVYTFSLSDIDPANISVVGDGGAFAVIMDTRGRAELIKHEMGGDVSHLIYVDLKDFADQTSAQRVANAFQHAAQLCANASPF